MILHQVEVKEWLNSRSSCAKVNSWSGLDPKRSFRQRRHACLLPKPVFQGIHVSFPEGDYLNVLSRPNYLLP